MKRLSLPFIAFIQAFGLVLYCSLVGLLFWRGNTWFGQMNNFLGPILMLSLFVVSALICALIALAYPFLVFWNKKNTKWVYSWLCLPSSSVTTFATQNVFG